jgi:hypothetical protein
MYWIPDKQSEFELGGFMMLFIVDELDKAIQKFLLKWIWRTLQLLPSE